MPSTTVFDTCSFVSFEPPPLPWLGNLLFLQSRRYHHHHSMLCDNNNNSATTTTTTTTFRNNNTGSCYYIPKQQQQQKYKQQQRAGYHGGRMLLEKDEEQIMSAKERKQQTSSNSDAAADRGGVPETTDAASTETKNEETQPQSTGESGDVDDDKKKNNNKTKDKKDDKNKNKNDDEQQQQEEVYREYSTPELTRDAAKHKAGLNDPERPSSQNPLHHNNPDMERMFPEDFNSQEEFEKHVIKIPALEYEDGSIDAPKHIAELVNECVHLTMLEMNELVHRLEEHYGFKESDLEPEGDDGGSDDDENDDGGADGGGGGGPITEKTVFDVKLSGFDTKSKIKIIKEVRAMAGLGLKEAKELVEKAPTMIQKGVKKEAAEEIKTKLEELGAQVEIV